MTYFNVGMSLAAINVLWILIACCIVGGRADKWWRTHQGCTCRWHDIAAVKVLSEGVQP